MAERPRLRLLALAVLPFALGLAMMRLLYRKRPIRRVAFDIGSGGTKMLVADVLPEGGGIVWPALLEVDTPVPFKADQQAHGRLSEEIQQRGLRVLGQMLEQARRLGAVEASAIATEVFRVAPNGGEFLQRVHDMLGLKVSVVTQPLEARLGLASAEALDVRQPGSSAMDTGVDRIAWDSGGGSFQITARSAGASGDEQIQTAELRAYTGRIGTSPAFKTLVMQVLGMGYEVHASPNPVRLCDAEKLIAQLSSQLDPPPDWLQGKHLAGIGGHNSLFAVALRALKGKGGDESGASLSTLEMRHALLNVVDKDDAQLMSVAGLGPHADRPLVVVPKVSLLIAVAEHLQLSGVTYLRMTGSCAGMMSLCEFEPLLLPSSTTRQGHGGRASL